jgi:hypothetical protein
MLFLGSGGQMNMAALDDKMVIRRSDINTAALDSIAVFRMARLQAA